MPSPLVVQTQWSVNNGERGFIRTYPYQIPHSDPSSPSQESLCVSSWPGPHSMSKTQWTWTNLFCLMSTSSLHRMEENWSRRWLLNCDKLLTKCFNMRTTLECAESVWLRQIIAFFISGTLTSASQVHLISWNMLMPSELLQLLKAFFLAIVWLRVHSPSLLKENLISAVVMMLVQATRRRRRQYKLTRTRKIVTIASVDAAGLINDGNFYEFWKVASQ